MAIKTKYRLNQDYYLSQVKTKSLTQEQLLRQQIEDLIIKVKGYYSLTSNERTEAINNVQLSLLAKSEQSIIDLANYETFKGYLFIACRNEVYGVFVVKNGKKVKATNSINQLNQTDKNHIDKTQTSKRDFKEEYQSLLKIVNDNERFIIEKVYEGYKQKEIAEMLGEKEKTITSRIFRIRKKYKYLNLLD